MNTPTYAGSLPHGHLFLLAGVVLVYLMAVPLTHEVTLPKIPFAILRPHARAQALAAQQGPRADDEVRLGHAFPAFPSEAIPAPSRPGIIWIPGFYRGTTAHGAFRWKWITGHYENPPNPGSVWIAPHIEDLGDGKVYIGGFWRE